MSSCLCLAPPSLSPGVRWEPLWPQLVLRWWVRVRTELLTSVLGVAGVGVEVRPGADLASGSSRNDLCSASPRSRLSSAVGTSGGGSGGGFGSCQALLPASLDLRRHKPAAASRPLTLDQSHLVGGEPVQTLTAAITHTHAHTAYIFQFHSSCCFWCP